MKFATRKHKKLKGVMPSYKADVGRFKIINRALVDGEQWYTVQVHPDVKPWIYEQPNRDKLWYNHIDNRWYTVANTFDMHEKIYTMLALRWS